MQNNFHDWNPKITTPAGLYVLDSDPTLFHIFAWPVWSHYPVYQSLLSNLCFTRYILTYVHANLGRILLGSGTVTVTWLRQLNHDIAVFCLPYVLGEILPQLVDELDKKHAFASLRPKTNDALPNIALGHTVLNMCLFPPLFFFYALYYTDVSSTLSVLVVYYCHLQGHRKSLVIAGLVSLWFRQTNIFWIAIFMGGLDLVRSLKKGRCGFEYAASPTFTDVILGSWRHTCIYDEYVHRALFAGLSLLSPPVLALTRLDRLCQISNIYRNCYLIWSPGSLENHYAIPNSAHCFWLVRHMEWGCRAWYVDICSIFNIYLDAESCVVRSFSGVSSSSHQ